MSPASRSSRPAPLSVILVHYHTPELAAAAVDALRSDLAERAAEVEWLLVDNGSDAAAGRLLRALPVEVIEPGENLGFAGGVNLGVERASGELVVVLNPDVLVRPGCTEALTDRLRRDAWAVGPRFFWDRGGRMLLPPPERRTRSDELLRSLAARGEGWTRRARRRWRRHARRHWQAREPLPSYHLSGALLGLRRSAFERIGPFDPGFPLYFEETDWLLRLERARLRAEHVPGAEAVHLYARSAVREPAAEGWFRSSQERFQRRHFGRWFPALWRALGGRPTPIDASWLTDVDLVAGLSPPPGAGGGCWVEMAPGPLGFPAAASPPRLVDSGPFRLPGEVRDRLEAGIYSLQWVDQAGAELGRLLFRAGAAPASHAAAPRAQVAGLAVPPHEGTG